MMKKLLILICCATLLSCGHNKRTKDTSLAQSEVAAVLDASQGHAVEENADRENLNDIRFAGWTKKEWADNEYIREVRRYIDAYNRGEIKDSDLDKCKDYIQGKFLIGSIEPGIYGGVFMYIIFYENPEKMFSVWVYSEVDEKTRIVSNYECRGLKMEDFESGFSQEDINQFLKECQEHRMW